MQSRHGAACLSPHSRPPMWTEATHAGCAVRDVSAAGRLAGRLDNTGGLCWLAAARHETARANAAPPSAPMRDTQRLSAVADSLTEMYRSIHRLTYIDCVPRSA